MRIVTVSMAVLLCCGVLLADQRPLDRAPRADGFPADQLRTYLGLSDQQLTDIKALQGQFHEDAKPLFEQIGEKAKELRQARQQDPVDSALVARIRADIEGLQNQVEMLRTQFQGQARSLLSADQMAKLAALEQALELLPAAHQAAGLNLLDAPRSGMGRVMGPQFGGPRGPGAPPTGLLRLWGAPRTAQRTLTGQPNLRSPRWISCRWRESLPEGSMVNHLCRTKNGSRTCDTCGYLLPSWDYLQLHLNGRLYVASLRSGRVKAFAAPKPGVAAPTPDEDLGLAESAR